MTALEAELREELDADGGAGDDEADPGAALAPGPAGRARGARRGDLPVLERLPRARQPPGRGPGGRRRRWSSTAPGPHRCGSSAASSSPRCALERDLAAFLGTEAALTFVSCWNANAALLDALCDERTAVFSDRLNHASIIDGMRLARPGHKAVYEHADVDDLRRALAAAPRLDRELIVTDGVFSMEGDLAPIAESDRGRRRARRDPDRRRLARDRRRRRDRARGARALRAPRPRRRDRHRDARQGARRRGGRFRRRRQRALRRAGAALAPAAVLERDRADRRRQLAPRARGARRER